MSHLLKKLLYPYMAPAGDGADLGMGLPAGDADDNADLGDDFEGGGTPTDVTDPAAASAIVKAAKAAAKEDPKKPLPKTAEEAEAEVDGEAEAKDKEGEEAEGEEGEGEEAKDKDAKKDSRIPFKRHKEIIEKERARRAEVEEQLAAYQKGGKVADLNEQMTETETKILDLEKEYAAFLADGEIAKATEAMSKIRRMERDLVEAKNDMKIAAAEARAVERTRYGVALERLEAAYPQLNPDEDEFDAELLENVVDLKGAYERKGMTPTAAMQKAVKTMIGVKGTTQTEATEVTPRVTEKDVAAERKKAAVQKVVDVSKKQPPNSTTVGKDSDKNGGKVTPEQVMKMKDVDFDKLTDEQLAELQGNEV